MSRAKAKADAKKRADESRAKSRRRIAGAMLGAVELLDTKKGGALGAWWRKVVAEMSPLDQSKLRHSLMRRSGQVERCSSGSWLRTYDGSPDGWQATRCRDRLCTTCWAMTSARREREVSACVEALDAEGLRLVPITLTWRVPRFAHPRREVALVLKGWRTLCQRSRRSDVWLGGWRKLEPTWRSPRPDKRGRRRVRPHIHIHAGVLVPKSASVDAVKDAVITRWCQVARDCGRYANPKGQDVEDARDLAAACAYFLKYIGKASDANHPAIAGLAAVALKHVHLVSAFGVCHAGSLRAKDPSPHAVTVQGVCKRLKAERERYSRATVGDMVEARPGESLPPGLIAATDEARPSWIDYRLHKASRTEAAEIEHGLPVTPAALIWGLEHNLPRAVAWWEGLDQRGKDAVNAAMRERYETGPPGAGLLGPTGPPGSPNALH